MPLDDRRGGLPQPQRPARVAELAPGPDDVGRGRGGQRGRRRPPRSSTSRQTGSDPGHRGLLQHHLADQDRPGVDVRPAPRQVAGGGGVPVDDPLSGAARRRRRPAGSWSRDPSVPSRGSGVPSRTRRRGHYRSLACGTRSARCPPASTGDGGCWCWPCSWPSSAGSVARDRPADRPGCDEHRRRGERPVVRPASRRSTGGALGGEGRDAHAAGASPPAGAGPRPSAAGGPAGGTVHRRDARPGGPDAADGRGRQQADLRAGGLQRLRGALRAALDKGAAGDRAAGRGGNRLWGSNDCFPEASSRHPHPGAGGGRGLPRWSGVG